MKNQLERHQFLDYYANLLLAEREIPLFKLKDFGVVTFTKAYEEIRSKLEKNEYGEWQVSLETKLGKRLLKELNKRNCFKEPKETISPFK